MREDRLLHLDPATGLYDRERFMAEVADLMSAQDPSLGALLLLIEPERLTRGQRPTLSVLRAVADVIRSTFRSSDIAGRLPEGRLVIALADTGSLSPQSVIARLYSALERYNSERDKRSRIAFTVAGRRLSNEQRALVQQSIDELQAEIAAGRAGAPASDPKSVPPPAKER